MYNVVPELLGLFNANNKQVMKNAEITVTVKSNVIIEVKQLTLNEEGLLNAEGVKVAKLIVNADQISLENLIVTGDVMLTDHVTDSFIVKNVKMENFITQEISETATHLRESAAVSTRLKITFTDSTVAYVKIRKNNVHFVVGGSTLVETFSVRAEGTLLVSPTAVLPNLRIEKGVTKVELNASIANVVIETENPVEISGKGNFGSVLVNTEQEVKISTEGTISKLQSNAQKNNIELGGTVKVGETIAHGEKVEPEKIIKNIDEVRENVNIEIHDGNIDPYFIVKPIPVKGKYGLFTLSLTNANNATIRYEYVDRSQKILTEGQSVSANSKNYTEGQEVNLWFTKDLHVYKVDANNKVIEAFLLSENQFPKSLMSEVTMKGNELTLKSIFKEELALEYLYIADDKLFWMTEERAQMTKDENGVPTVTLKVGNNINIDEGTTYAVYFNLNSSLTSMELFGDYKDYQDVILNLLKVYKEKLQPIDKYEGFTARDYYLHLENLIREIKQDYPDIPGFRRSYYKFELEEILNDLTVFNSIEEVKAVVSNVDKRLASDVQKYNEAGTELNNLYRDDRHIYNYEDQLRPDLTMEEINIVKEKVEALPERTDKETIKRNLDSIIYLFGQIELKPLSATIDKKMRVILQNFVNDLTKNTYTQNEISQVLWDISQSEEVTTLNEEFGITISIWYHDNNILYNFNKGEGLWSLNVNFPLDNITVTPYNSGDTTFRQALSVELPTVATDTQATYGQKFNEAQGRFFQYWVSDDGKPFSSTIEW